MLNLNDPNIDPIKLLDEFKQWGFNNKIYLNSYTGKSKLKSLIGRWLRDKYQVNSLELFIFNNNTYDEYVVDLKNLVDDLMMLWKTHMDL